MAAWRIRQGHGVTLVLAAWRSASRIRREGGREAPVTRVMALVQAAALVDADPQIAARQVMALVLGLVALVTALVMALVMAR